MTPRATPAGVPVTWPELIAQSRAPVSAALAAIGAAPEPPADDGGGSIWLLADELTAPTITLAMGAALFGGARCRPHCDALIPLAARAADELAADGLAENAEVTTYMLSFLDVAECCGARPTPSLEKLAPSWLDTLAERAAELRELERRNFAFAALGAGRPDLIHAFILGGALPDRLEPGQSFGFNVQGFVRYLAVAMVKRAAPIDVEPAWRDFLANFPRKLAAGTLDWTDLLWSARAVHARIGGQPVGTTADTLHADVAAMP